MQIILTRERMQQLLEYVLLSVILTYRFTLKVDFRADNASKRNIYLKTNLSNFGYNKLPIIGVFGTHPNAYRGMPTPIGHVESGSNCWTTLFDQHNTTKQTYTIPPAQAIPVNFLFGIGQVCIAFLLLIYAPFSIYVNKLMISAYFVVQSLNSPLFRLCMMP